MEQKRKEYRQAYRKNFIHNPDFSGSELIRNERDIPTNNEFFKNTTYQAYAYLSCLNTQDISKMKILSTTQKLIKRNETEIQTKTNPIKFAVVLFVLHYYCVRIQRSPWRKDFLIIKAYTGFHEYTFKKWISPNIIMELFAMIDFIYHPNLDSFIYSNHASPDFQTIKEAGMDLFLTFTYCMTKNDPNFKRSIRATRTRTESSLEISGPSGLTRNSTRLSSPQSSAREVSPQPSSSRERRREKNYSEIQEKNSFRGRQGSSLYTQMSLGMTFPRDIDIYRPQEAPIDLSSKKVTPVRRSQVREQPSRGSPNSDYDDQALYGAPDSNGHYNGSHDFVPSLENSISEKVLYPPNTSPGNGLDMQMEFCGIQDQQNYIKQANSEKHSDNYVKLTPMKGQRGKPDGQNTYEGYRDPLSPNWQYAKTTQIKNPSQKTNRRREHIYQEINDNDMYGP